MARYNDNDPTGSQNAASAALPVPPTVNAPPPALPPVFTQRPAVRPATSGIVRPDTHNSGNTNFATAAGRPISGGAAPTNAPVGATINGVPTFSDGTVPKGFIDRTAAVTVQPDAASTIQRPTPSGTFNGQVLTGPAIDRLASSVNTIPSENFIRPGIGTLGVPVSPDAGVNTAMNIQRPVPQAVQSDISRPAATERPGLYDPTQAASTYRSDLADVINNDPRSVSGTAAHNARADLVWGLNTAGNRTQRSAALANYQQAMGGLTEAGRGAFDAQIQAGLTNARDQTAFADNANRNTANVTRAGLLADSRLGAADARADAMNYGADARADSARYVADARANTPKIDAAADAAFSRAYQAALKNGATTDEARTAAGNVRLDLLRLRQRGTADTQQPDGDQPPAPPVQSGSPPTSPSRQSQQQMLYPPVGAIQLLQKNPQYADQFDAMYGNGAAAQYLRSR